ncbi:MAG: C25 family cysteine peptidase [Anaerolineales bacterium]
MALKLNSAGTYQWHTFYGSADNDVGIAVISDGSGNVYVAGYSNATWNGPGAVASLNAFAGGANIVVVKIKDGISPLNVTVEQAASQTDPTRAPTINFTATFSKPINVSTFTNADVTLGGTAGASTAVISQVAPNDGTTFNIAVSGMSSFGVVTASLAVGVVSDAVGNPNIASTGADNSVTYDELDTACANVPTITLGQDHADILRVPDDIDPYKFEVTAPYTTIVASLTPPADGDFTLNLFGACDGASIDPWDIGRAWHIGRVWHIGGDADRKIEVRFNVGKKAGPNVFYYLAVQRAGGGVYSAASYQLHVELQPPDFGLVDTLILYNPSRFKDKYGLDAASQMMDKLTQLAGHPKVNGLIVQLDQFPAVVEAYDHWVNTPVSNGNENSYTSNVAAANAVSDQIRAAMLEFMLTTKKLVTGYVVVVGDDDQIPFRRLAINPDPIIGDPNWMSEKTYFLGLGDTANMPIDAALLADQTLSDDFYGNYRDLAGAGFLPSFAVGRLLDTPERIQKMTDSFLDHNGVIDLSAPGASAAIAGYDFLADSAQQTCNRLTNGGLVTDCALIGVKFTRDDLFQKFIVNAPNLAGYYGHTNHGQLFTPIGSPLTAEQISAASFAPSSSLWWVIGCQSGLVLPKSENHPLSLAQSLGDHGITYLGNTGWAWGADGPLTYSELFYQLFTEKLTQGGGMPIGEALRLAKRDYFYTTINNAYGKGENYLFSDYDNKAMAEATLYGLPMLKFNFPATASTHAKPVSQKAVTQLDAIAQAVPAQFHPLLITPGNLTQVVQQYKGNTYYTDEQGEFSAAPKTPLLPQSEYFNFDTSLGRAKGVIWKGGSYTILRGNNPLVLKPTQLNAAPGLEPVFNGTSPLLPVALVGLEKLDGTFTNHLTFQTGQYIGIQASGTLRLFSYKQTHLAQPRSNTGATSQPRPYRFTGRFSTLSANQRSVECPASRHRYHW